MSKLLEVAKVVGGKVYNEGNPETEIQGGYTGDLLSSVMREAYLNCAWFTVMNNVNVIAVADLVGVGAVIVCGGVIPDEYMTQKAKQRGVNVIVTELNAYEAIVKYDKYLHERK